MKTNLISVLIVILAISASFLLPACSKKSDIKPEVKDYTRIENQNFSLGTTDLKETGVNGDSVWKAYPSGYTGKNIYYKVDGPDEITVFIPGKTIPYIPGDEYLFTLAAAKKAVAKVGKKLPSFSILRDYYWGLNQGWYKEDLPHVGIFVWQPAKATVNSWLYLKELAWGMWADDGISNSLFFYAQTSGNGNQFHYSRGDVFNSQFIEECGGDSFFTGQKLLSVRCEVPAN